MVKRSLQEPHNKQHSGFFSPLVLVAIWAIFMVVFAMLVVFSQDGSYKARKASIREMIWAMNWTKKEEDPKDDQKPENTVEIISENVTQIKKETVEEVPATQAPKVDIDNKNTPSRPKLLIFSDKNDEIDKPDIFSLVVRADIDADRDMDQVEISWSTDEIIWLENPGFGTPKSQWKRHIIASETRGITSLSVEDIDMDGDLDVLVFIKEKDMELWYENDGRSPPGWVGRIH